MESVNDGLFHTVELLIQNRSLSLVVDNGAPKSLGKLARQPSVDHNTQLYIGGTHTHQSVFVGTCSEHTDVTFVRPALPFCGRDYMFSVHGHMRIQSAVFVELFLKKRNKRRSLTFSSSARKKHVIVQ